MFIDLFKFGSYGYRFHNGQKDTELGLFASFDGLFITKKENVWICLGIAQKFLCPVSAGSSSLSNKAGTTC